MNTTIDFDAHATRGTYGKNAFSFPEFVMPAPPVRDYYKEMADQLKRDRARKRRTRRT